MRPRTLFPLVLAASLASSVAAQESPLETKVTLKMKQVALQAYLKEVARQAKLAFNFDPGLEHCRVTAFLKNRTAKEALQIALEVRGISYQRIGSSELFVISPRKGAPVCPAPPPPARPKGACRRVKGAPISLQCASAPLVDYAEKIHDAAGISFFFTDKGENLPVTAKLREATYVDAIGALSSVPSLAVRRQGTDLYLLARTEK